MKKLTLLLILLAGAHHPAAAQESVYDFIESLLSVEKPAPELSCDEPLKEVVAKSDLIVAASIAEVKPSPGFWSGFTMTYQFVDYIAPEVLKGELGHYDFSASYFLAEGGRISDREKPGLSPDLFYAGLRQIVFIKRVKPEDQRYGTRYRYPAAVAFMPNETLCALREDPETLHKVREALRERQPSGTDAPARRQASPPTSPD